MSSRPKVSLLHPSARPDKWREIFLAWKSAAANPSEVEYILSIDPRWGFEGAPGEFVDPEFARFVQVVNTGRRCYVDSVNTAAKVSTGEILIVIADDQYPCERWDTAILQALANAVPEPELRRGHFDEFVMEVSTGTVLEHDRGIIVMPILSRARYDKLGYVFYPEYESMYADNDFCEQARQDEVVIDARHLLFPHRHPLIPLQQAELKKGRPLSDAFSKFIQGADEAYKAQNRMEAYRIGQQVYERRRAAGFGAAPQKTGASVSVLPQKTEEARLKRIIALALPGESFSKEWVSSVLGLQQYLCDNEWAPFVHQTHCSVVYFTRQVILESLLSQEPKPEFVLWLDHDNLLSVEHFKLLLQDLESWPDIDSVAGWYWTDNHDGTYNTSVGVADASGMVGYAGGDIEGARGLIECAWHGFGAVLMRYSCLEKAGDHPFLPFSDPKSHHRMSGEDVAFCQNATQRGDAKFLIDPRVHVPHLKLGQIGRPPDRPEPVIVAAIRAKNESASIRRCIASIQGLCKTVLLLDDHSTDDTALIADSMGATVYASPFSDRDEGRDRQYLLEKAREAKADWIFLIDADEALDPRDVEVLRRACKMSGSEALHLRWMNLWDSESQIRVDGIYSKGSPPRLYKVTPSLRLASMSNGVHVWPIAEVKRGFVDVRLWHWGYLKQEDRLRRFAWYNEKDPANEAEDCYRHMVQGDLVSYPASAVLKKAGPLKFEPVELPDFENAACGPELEHK